MLNNDAYDTGSSPDAKFPCYVSTYRIKRISGSPWKEFGEVVKKKKEKRGGEKAGARHLDASRRRVSHRIHDAESISIYTYNTICNRIPQDSEDSVHLLPLTINFSP